MIELINPDPIMIDLLIQLRQVEIFLWCILAYMITRDLTQMFPQIGEWLQERRAKVEGETVEGEPVAEVNTEAEVIEKLPGVNV